MYRSDIFIMCMSLLYIEGQNQHFKITLKILTNKGSFDIIKLIKRMTRLDTAKSFEGLLKR